MRWRRCGEVNAGEYNTRLVAQVKRIRAAEEEYAARIPAWSEAERLFKLGWSKALLQVEGKNADERSARAEVEMVKLEDIDEPISPNALRYSMRLAEGMMNAAKLAAQNRVSELSALQSEASLAKEEAKFANFAPAEVMPT